jgi:hypothetical protein
MPSEWRHGNLDRVSFVGQRSTSLRAAEVRTSAALRWFRGFFRDPRSIFVDIFAEMYILQVGAKRALQ